MLKEGSGVRAKIGRRGGGCFFQGIGWPCLTLSLTMKMSCLELKRVRQSCSSLNTSVLEKIAKLGIIFLFVIM